jgi:hypothetical protein
MPHCHQQQQQPALEDPTRLQTCYQALLLLLLPRCCCRCCQGNCHQLLLLQT